MGWAVASGYFLVEYQMNHIGSGDLAQDWTAYDPDQGFIYKDDQYIGDIRFTPRPGVTFGVSTLQVWTTYNWPPWEGGAGNPYRQALVGDSSKYPIKYSDYLDQKWINDVPGEEAQEWSNQWVNLLFDVDGVASAQSEYIAFFRTYTYKQLETYVQFTNRNTGEATEWYPATIIGGGIEPPDAETFISGVQIKNAGVGERFTAWSPDFPPETDPNGFWEATQAAEGDVLEIPKTFFTFFMENGVQMVHLYARVPEGELESSEYGMIFISH